jgi:hypothetical protein
VVERERDEEKADVTWSRLRYRQSTTGTSLREKEKHDGCVFLGVGGGGGERQSGKHVSHHPWHHVPFHPWLHVAPHPRLHTSSALGA